MSKFDISPRFVNFGGNPNELPFTRYFLNQWLETNLLEPPENFEDGIKKIFSKDVYGSEADTETKIIRPVFELLGFDVLTEKKDIENIGQPDQVYYDCHDSAKKRKLAGILVIVEAKAWEEPLKAAHEKQIRDYIDLANTRSNQNVKWGILTNGKLWRLYKAGKRGYIEFNLEKLADAPILLDLARESNNNKSLHLTLFYTLFRREAFENSGKFLSSIVAQSEQYQREIETELHRQAYPAFLAIFNGYWELIKDKIPENQKEEKIKEAYEDSLYYLYRLLFILFAKGRKLNFYQNLPTSNKNLLDRLTKDAPIQYNNQNGEIIFGIHVEEAKEEIFSRYSFANVSAKLTDMFNWLDGGYPYKKIPQYNGNLFKSRPIDGAHISDYYISMAMRLLEYGPGGASLDYSSLDIRHLGNIYERLLLFDVPKQGKEYDFYYEGIVGKGKKVKLTFPEKWFYFDVDPSERKSTGTYYTPDYIVKYIVKNTAGKKLDEIMDSKNDDQLRQILSLKVLDPAMGSGHFLVRVVDQISSFIMENLGNIHLEKPEMNIISQKEGSAKGFGDITNLVRELIGEWDKFEPVRKKLTSEIFWQRIVAKRCIYGVDLKPFAVELAKLALWLHTLSEDEPLQFLDHHLRCGNSLIGVWDVSDIVSEDTDKFKDFIKPIKDILEISQLRDSSIEEVKRSQELYEHVHERLEKFITRLDVALAARHFMEFEDEKNKDTIVNQIEQAVEKGEKHPRLAEAKKIAEDKRFFHWKIEFPEIWYSDQFMNRAEEKENAGFDVVVGNPPYGAALTKEDRNYVGLKYDIGSTDTAILFSKLSYDLLQSNGVHGYIVPKAFSYSSNYEKIRNFLWDNFERIIDCGKVWDEVKLEQLIFTFYKKLNIPFYKSGKREDEEIEIIGNIDKKTSNEFGFLLNGVSEKEIGIALKMKNNSIMLNDIATNKRGAMLQKYLSDNAELDVIGGAEIQRFGIVGVKGKITEEDIYKDDSDEENKYGLGNSDKAFIENNSVLVQNIVAHIQNPIDHIKITACIPQNVDLVLVDTINQITLQKEYCPEYIWCLLNSELLNWYAYRFIFGKAIRTMHFDSPVTSKIPVKILDKKSQLHFITKADIMLTKHKELQEQADEFLYWLQAEYNVKKLSNKLTTFYELEEDEFINEVKKKSSQKRLSPTQLKDLTTYFNQYKDKIKSILQIISETDKEIDNMVYQLYGLTDEEIKIVEES